MNQLGTEGKNTKFISKWGYMDDTGDYILTTPETPRPWENYLYSTDGHLHSIISQRGRGSLFYCCEMANLICQARNYSLRDNNTGLFWSLNGGFYQKDQDEFRCRHSAGSTQFLVKNHDIISKLTFFINPYTHAEMSCLVLRNTSSRTRNLSLIGSYLTELSGISNGNQLECTQFDAKLGAIFAQKYYYGTPQFKYVSYYLADRLPVSFCGSREAFLGADMVFENALSWRIGKLPNLNAHATPMVQALSYEIELAPNCDYHLNFVLGIANDFDTAVNDAKNYAHCDVWQDAHVKCKDFYAQLTANFIKTNEPALDELVNKWTRIQLHRQVISSRFSFMHNWRNNLQDAWAWMMFDPSLAKSYLAKLCQLAKADGFLSRSSQRFVELGKNHHSLYQRHNDIAVWAVTVAARYAAETGDLDFFNNKIKCANDTKTLCVIDCLINSVKWLINHRGRHGMVLMLDGDWSDPLEEAGKKGIGESPWTSVACVYAIKHFAPLLRKLSRNDIAYELENLSAELTDAVNQNAWDGMWYIRGITDSGIRFCSSKDNDAQISLLMQAWAILAGVVPPDRMGILLKSIDEHLKTNIGPILYGPPFLHWRPEIGRETVKQPGTGENGSVYVHGAMMLAMAEALAGRPDEALGIIRKVLPLREEDCTEITKSVPLWFPNYWHGPHSVSPGLSSGIISTGAPAWLYLVVCEGLLGIKPTLDGLEIKPNLPSSWKTVEIERCWRGKHYKFNYRQSSTCSDIIVLCNGKKLMCPCILH